MSLWSSVLRAGLLALLVSVVWLAHGLMTPKLSVEVTQWTEIDALAEVYYGHELDQYSPYQRFAWQVEGGQWQELGVEPEPRNRLQSIRIDPIQESAEVRIREVRVSSRWGSAEWRGDGLRLVAYGLNDGAFGAVQDDYVEFVSTGLDPHFSLSVPPELYRPGLAAVLPILLRVAFGTFLLWLALEMGARAGGRFFPARLQVLRNAVFYVPVAVGNAAVERPTRFVFWASVVFLPLFFLAHLHVSNITPFFQGPDEGAHITNSFHGFNNLAFEGSGHCHEMWDELNAVQAVTDKMVRRHRVQLNEEDVYRLTLIDQRSVWAESERYLESAKHHSCGSSNRIHRYAYNVLTLPVFLVRDDVTAIDYLKWLRHGQTLLAFLLYAAIFWIIARGHFVLKELVDVHEGLLRIVLFLAVLFYIGIPQNVFMISVVNREAYLVPLGILIFVSFLFRTRFLSPLLLLLAVYAFWPRKAAYLPLIALLAGWYVAVFLSRGTRSRMPLYGISALALTTIALVPWLLTVLHAHRAEIPVRFPSELKLLEDGWAHYYREIVSFSSDLYTLGFLNWASFFGRFGWLDTVQPEAGLVAFKAVLVLLVILLISSLLFLRETVVSRSSRGNLGTAHVAVGSFFIAAVPLTVAMIAYAIFGYLYIECYPRRWGCAVQGRYFLPIYFFGFFYWVFAAFSLFLFRFREAHVRWLGVSLMAFVGMILFAIALNIQLMDQVISARYFESAQVRAAYLELLR
jgi:hypothetical protein